MSHTTSDSLKKYYSHTPNTVALIVVFAIFIFFVTSIVSTVTTSANYTGEAYKRPANIIHHCKDAIYQQVPEVSPFSPRLGLDNEVIDHGHKVVEVKGKSDSYTYDIDKGPQKIEFSCTLDASNNTIVDVKASLVNAQ